MEEAKADSGRLTASRSRHLTSGNSGPMASSTTFSQLTTSPPHSVITQVTGKFLGVPIFFGSRGERMNHPEIDPRP